MSRVGEAKSFIGTTSSPHDIAKQLHRFNWEDTECNLVAWTDDKKLAQHLLKIVKMGLEPVHHRDSWYAIEGDRARQIVIALAERAHVEIFGDAERERRIQDKVAQEIGVIKRRMDGGMKQIVGLPPARQDATIIPLKRPRKDQ